MMVSPPGRRSIRAWREETEMWGRHILLSGARPMEVCTRSRERSYLWISPSGVVKMSLGILLQCFISDLNVVWQC